MQQNVERGRSLLRKLVATGDEYDHELARKCTRVFLHLDRDFAIGMFTYLECTEHGDGTRLELAELEREGKLTEAEVADILERGEAMHFSDHQPEIPS